MREILIRFSTGRNISILLVLFLVFNIWILPGMIQGEKPLDLEIYYTAEEAYQRIDSFPKEIRES